MDRTTFKLSRNTPRRNTPTTFSTHHHTLLHPALAYPTEADSIHRSLDLSFQQLAAVSRLDRQIIDNLCRTRR